MLFVRLRKRLGTIGMRSYIDCFVKSASASGVMGFVVYFIYMILSSVLTGGTIVQGAALGVAIIAGALVYFALCYVFKIREFRILVDKAAARFLPGRR